MQLSSSIETLALYLVFKESQILSRITHKLVCAGTSDNLVRYRRPYEYLLPDSKRTDDIVGMGIDGTSNYTYAWFR